MNSKKKVFDNYEIVKLVDYNVWWFWTLIVFAGLIVIISVILAIVFSKYVSNTQKSSS